MNFEQFWLHEISKWRFIAVVFDQNFKRCIPSSKIFWTVGCAEIRHLSDLLLSIEYCFRAGLTDSEAEGLFYSDFCDAYPICYVIKRASETLTCWEAACGNGFFKDSHLDSRRFRVGTLLYGLYCFIGYYLRSVAVHLWIWREEVTEVLHHFAFI